MSNNEWQAFNKDSRVKCKYGKTCYQKNPEHHKTYKHPPNTPIAIKENREKRRFSPFARKPKELQTRLKEQEPKPGKETLDDEEKNKKIYADPGPSLDEYATSSSEINNTFNADHVAGDLSENLKCYKDVDQKVFKDLFLVDMPPDFYKFYECLNTDNLIETVLASVNLQLVGPFDLLLGKLPIVNDKDLYLIHWRFFYDPPEFQAILKKKGSSQFHFGYYRDSPEEDPIFVASNDSEKDYRITPIAENIFGAVYSYLQNEKKRSPFTAMACQRVMDKLKKAADEQKISLEEYNMKIRQKNLVAKTLHGAGIVVPYNKKTQLGYRYLVETDGEYNPIFITVHLELLKSSENLKKIFKKLQDANTQDEKDKALTELQPVITYASIAVDECDFGTGLEAGIDLFCSGLKELHPSALSTLTSAYSLLNRDAFGKIIVAHLKYRRKGANLSILDFV